MSKGWIKLHRQIINKVYFKKPDRLAVWILILLKANHTEREEMLGGKKIICKPGQFTTGRKQMAKELGISESRLERTLTYFEKIEQQIEQQKTTRNRLISITKWNEYQLSEQQIEQQVNNKWTTNEHTIRIKELENPVLVRKENFKKNENGKENEFSGNNRRRGEEICANRIIQGIEASNKQREENSGIPE